MFGLGAPRSPRATPPTIEGKDSTGSGITYSRCFLSHSARQVVALEALLARFLAVDAISGVPGSLTADLEAAREICAVVEGLIAGREWRA